MIAAARAREMMIEHRKARVEQEIYSSIKLGFVGVVVEADLVSDAMSVGLLSLGYKVFPVSATEEHGPGIKITWSEKV